MHLTEAASHCVSGMNGLMRRIYIFRCPYSQIWNYINLLFHGTVIFWTKSFPGYCNSEGDHLPSKVLIY